MVRGGNRPRRTTATANSQSGNPGIRIQAQSVPGKGRQTSGDQNDERGADRRQQSHTTQGIRHCAAILTLPRSPMRPMHSMVAGAA